MCDGRSCAGRRAGGGSRAAWKSSQTRKHVTVFLGAPGASRPGAAGQALRSRQVPSQRERRAGLRSARRPRGFAGSQPSRALRSGRAGEQPARRLPARSRERPQRARPPRLGRGSSRRCRLRGGARGRSMSAGLHGAFSVPVCEGTSRAPETDCVHLPCIRIGTLVVPTRRILHRLSHQEWRGDCP